MEGWDLFREMENLRREMDRAFSHIGMGRFLSPTFFPGLGTRDFPHINLKEDEDCFYVEALVPGMDPQDMDLNIMQGTLTLSGERKEIEEGRRTWHRRERGSGKFLRTIELPKAVNAEKIDAEYRNGILTVTLYKAEQSKAKKIAVKTG